MRKKLNWWKSRIKTYFIFWEWETEKCYFSALSELFWNENWFSYKIVSIKYEQIWTSKEKLKFTRNTILNTIYQNYNWVTENELIKLESKIFILLDTDWNNWYTKEQIDNIKNFFKGDNLFEVLFSNKDFELYLLLHLEYYDWTNFDYISMIKKHYKEFEKGISIKLKKIHKEIIEKWFKKTLPINITKLKNNHSKLSNIHIKDKLPFTEVYEIFR
jgi:hypothetical protein